MEALGLAWRPLSLTILMVHTFQFRGLFDVWGCWVQNVKDLFAAVPPQIFKMEGDERGLSQVFFGTLFFAASIKETPPPL